jgi:hypothetical protein
MTTGVAILSDLALIVAWWLLSLLVGLACLALPAPAGQRSAAVAPNRELVIFFGVALGIAVQMAVLIMLAQFGQLHQGGVFGAAVVLLLSSVALLARRRGSHTLPWLLARPSRNEVIHSLPLLLVIGTLLIRPFGPPMSYDEVSYHLPYARFYLAQGGLAVNEYLRFPFHAHQVHLLYSVALLRDGVTLAHLIHASFGVLVLIGVHGMARYWLGWGSAVLALLAVLMAGEFIPSFRNAYVDLGSMLFIAAAMFALALWQEHRRPAFLLASGIFLGTAIGTKYHALVFAVPLGLWVLWAGRRLSHVLWFTLLVCAFGLFWYVRSFLLSGNPVHPYAAEFFGHYIWTAEDVRESLAELQSHGFERSLSNFLRLPQLLLTDSEPLHGKALSGVLVAGLFAGLLGIRWLRPAMRPMVLVCLFGLVFWFLSAHVMRYMLPMAPAMALSTVAILSALADRARLAYTGLRGSRAAGVGAAAGTGRGMVIIIALVAALSLNQLQRDLRSTPIAADAKEQYLRENISGYELFNAAAADPRIGSGPLLQFGLAGSTFHYPGTLYGDWFGHYAYRKFMREDPETGWQLMPPGGLHAQMQVKGIRGVVFSHNPSWSFFPPNMDEFERWFAPVFENRFGIVMVPRQQALD